MMSAATLKAEHPTIPSATPSFSYGPLMLDVPGRLVAMEVKVTAPAVGDQLPVLLLSDRVP
jgi:hypothetical protein